MMTKQRYKWTQTVTLLQGVLPVTHFMAPLMDFLKAIKQSESYYIQSISYISLESKSFDQDQSAEIELQVSSESVETYVKKIEVDGIHELVFGYLEGTNDKMKESSKQHDIELKQSDLEVMIKRHDNTPTNLLSIVCIQK